MSKQIMDKFEDFYNHLNQTDYTVGHADLEVNTIYIRFIEEIQPTDANASIALNKEREALQFVKTANEGLETKDVRSRN